MSYEVEKRSLLKNISEFNRCRQFLLDNGIFIKEENFKSFLFKQPSYLRLRVKQNDDFSIVAYKENTEYEGVRKEIELKLDFDQTQKFSEIINNIGYKKCALISTRRLIFEYQGVNLELNDVENLGLILEAEVVTDSETEIISIQNKIDEIFKQLKVEELNLDIYLKMKEKLYIENGINFNPSQVKF